MVQKSALGKGLASLIPPVSLLQADLEDSIQSGIVDKEESKLLQKEISNKDQHPGISVVSLQEIQMNPYQPRRDFDEKSLEDLAQSIRSNGVIQPLVVRRHKEGGYELIAGERRFRAAQKAGLKQVPVVIRKSTDKESLELALIENIQREDLNCIDEALAYFQLIEDFALTQEEVAEQVGKDRATVANSLRLLRLPEEIIEDLRRGLLSIGHGKVLLSLEEMDLKMYVRKQILDQRLSVRETETLVLSLKKKAASLEFRSQPSELTSIENRLHQLSSELARYWSTRVEVKGSDKKGKIMIYYHSREEFDRLIDAMHYAKEKL